MIKNPLNYTGSKIKLLPKLLPLFPPQINNFYDVFCGGLNVSLNVEANSIFAFDVVPELIQLYQDIQTNQNFKQEVEAKLAEYNITTENREGFLRLRDEYNSNKNSVSLFALISHSFNYYLRFNSKGCYNVPFRKGHSGYTPTMAKNLVEFIDTIRKPEFHIARNSFEHVLAETNFEQLDFVYCDPPYLITTANYNTGWQEQHDIKLYKLLDELTDKGVKWGLSNVFSHKGKTNNILVEWAKKYNVHHLDHSYNLRVIENQETDEVFVTNYDTPKKNVLDI